MSLFVKLNYGQNIIKFTILLTLVAEGYMYFYDIFIFTPGLKE